MRKLILSLLVLSLALIGQAAELKDDHPDRYIVKEGDTLWDIASVFLKDAWQWPEIWHVNPDIENPHVIYPGDEIFLRYVDGKPQLAVNRGNTEPADPTTQPVRQGDRYERLSPEVRDEPLVSAIPAIPLERIAGMLNTARIVSEGTLDDAPYILGGAENALVMGPGSELYGRGEFDEDTLVYGIFRKGEVYLDPETREVLGYEAKEIGLARAISLRGDVMTFKVNSVEEEVRIGDRLLPTEERRLESTFLPHPPKVQVEGVVTSLIGALRQVGQYAVVVLNRGSDDGLDTGAVLVAEKDGELVRDRLTRQKVQLPAERIGVVMVFRVFDRMSYALVLETSQPIRVGFRVHSPQPRVDF